MNPRMSLEEFVNFVRSKPLAEVAALPDDVLPDNLPAEMVRTAPQKVVGCAVSSLPPLWSVRSFTAI